MECGMERRFHRGFTAAEKTELWDRWKRGESLKAIGRAFGKESSVGIDACGTRGDFQRCYGTSIGSVDRKATWPLTLDGEPGKSRNGGYNRYRATLADENASARSRRPKCCKLAINSRLRRSVARKLRLDWSPEQIAGWLKRTHHPAQTPSYPLAEFRDVFGCRDRCPN